MFRTAAEDRITDPENGVERPERRNGEREREKERERERERDFFR